jgi:polar amino acid transport system substrate-binding protein
MANILSIGVDASAPLPLHSDPRLPAFEGFEVDLMKSVANRLGVQVSYKNALWSELLDYLVEARVDMICTASTITKERKESSLRIFHQYDIPCRRTMRT